MLLKNKSKRVRTRFAPSPTGAAHLGSCRTFLFNYLFAKQNNGDFILRIEDTDQTRFVPGAEEYVIEALKWSGITPNEGVGFGDGPYSPYRQSERKHIYKKYVDQLLSEGKAYYAFDTKLVLDTLRDDAESKRKSGISMRAFAYDSYTRNYLINSLTMSDEELKRRLDNNEEYVVRLKVMPNEEIKFKDVVRGVISVKSNTIDDKVIFKSDGMPTYHLANVVDDHLMDISHVIRGDEWLISCSFHVLLYQYLGWEDTMPEFVHLPLILGPKGKLSKRDGDALGFPVFPLDWIHPTTGEKAMGFREKGYLKEAFVNMLALLGWSPGSNIEMMSIEEMIEKFSFSRIGKAGAKFDLKKAEWFNQQYMIKADNKYLADLFTDVLIKNGVVAEKNDSFVYFEYLKEELEEIKDYWKEVKAKKPEFYKFMENDVSHVRASSVPIDYVENVCGLLKQKVYNINDFWKNGEYFFNDPFNLEMKEYFDHPLLSAFLDEISNIEKLTHDNSKTAFENAYKKLEFDPRNAGKILRSVITGMQVGPPMFDILELLGKDVVIRRLKLNIIKQKL